MLSAFANDVLIVGHDGLCDHCRATFTVKGERLRAQHVVGWEIQQWSLGGRVGHVPFSCVKGASLCCCSAVFIFLRQPAMLPGEGMEGTPCGSSPDVGSTFPQGNIHCLMLLVTPV